MSMKKEASETPKQKSILFIGNIPFNKEVTADEVREVMPKKLRKFIQNIRLLSEKGTNKPKGIGFMDVTDRKRFDDAYANFEMEN